MRKPSATLLFIFSIWAVLTAVSAILKLFHLLYTYKGNGGYMTNYMSGYAVGHITGLIAKIILLPVLAVYLFNKAKQARKQSIVAQ